MAGALKRDRDHALMLRAGSCFVVGKYFSVRGHEASQGLRIFVIDVTYLSAAKVADFSCCWLHLIKMVCLQPRFLRLSAVLG